MPTAAGLGAASTISEGNTLLATASPDNGMAVEAGRGGNAAHAACGHGSWDAPTMVLTKSGVVASGALSLCVRSSVGISSVTLPNMAMMGSGWVGVMVAVVYDSTRM